MEQSLEEQLYLKLKEKHLTIATAESCTGGLLAGTICNVPGVSACFNEGYVTYSNEAKHRLIHVSQLTLLEHGAVSEETAYEMAEGTAKAARSDVSLVTTGIAGPDGGSEEKPVGLVYIGCYFCGTVTVKKFVFTGNRSEVRAQAVREALSMALEQM